MKARKKPVEVEVMQFTFDNKDQVFNWITCNRYPEFDETNMPTLKIQTLEGDMEAKLGDYIIKCFEGEFYPCDYDIFHKTYDLIEEE